MSIIDYLSSGSESERINMLDAFEKDQKGLSIELTNALIQLPVSDLEKYKVIEATRPEDGLEWEKFLIDGILNWPQNISARLIKLWAENTSRVLHPLLNRHQVANELPQRVFYTIVDLVSPFVGKSFYESYASSTAIAEYSPALHGLMMLRGVQFNSMSNEVMSCAQNYLQQGLHNKYADSKGFLEAIIYYARFNPEVLATAASGTNCDPWNSLLNSVAFYANNLENYLPEIESTLSSSSLSIEEFNNNWPILPFRHKISILTIEHGLRFVVANESILENQSKIFDIFSGCENKNLIKALENYIENDSPSPEKISCLLEGLYGLLGFYEGTSPGETISSAMVSSTSEAHQHLFFSNSKYGFVDELKDKSFENKTELNKIFSSAHEHLKEIRDFYKSLDVITYENTSELNWCARSLYDPEGHSETFPKSESKYWKLLTNGITTQNKKELEELTIESRKQPFLVNLCFIRALGRYEGNNEAALRLMDFIRSTNEIEISEVIQSLAGINTPRSLQELIGSITRPNLTESAKLEACRLLQNRDVESLQPELKAAISDLEMKKDRNESWYEIRDILKSLLKTQVDKSPDTIIAPEQPAVDLDEKLEEKIPYYRDLSSEVKRALRTGQFFYDQVTGPNSTENIEISPIIDMVYKSLELQFRESFEALTMSLVKGGNLQRKLDIIGYARPIPKQMDAFEDYISKLDVIKEIPFFSKFKLRKMLRALCQYKPGKRFTLDGIKAFALFFLCFSRKQCQYGLANLIDIGMKNDAELFEFVKSLHILQDFRNRAVHEGFRPEARNDIEGIWASAGEIYEQVFTICDYLSEAEATSKSAG
jgi:hypothetical protein